MRYVARMILLRHGQSEFNLRFTATRRDPGIHDPPLTALGQDQAEQVARDLAGVEIRRIIASPYTRALQTAAPIAAARKLPVLVHPLVRERYAFSCDIGSPRSALIKAWPDHDFSGIEDMWWPTAEEPEEVVSGRARRFREEMAMLPDWRDTLVVSHWGFLLALTGISFENASWQRFELTV